MIPAVILAAGKSTRMGRAKAMLPLDDEHTFLTRVIKTFREAEVEDVVVVVGHDGRVIADALIQSDVAARIVENAEYEAGQLSSILTGLRAIDRPGVTAMLLTLVDVPLVSPDTVRAVIERYRRSRAPVVRPVNRDRHGHPVLIGRSLFDRLRGADPATGAKSIVRAFASVAGDVEVVDEGAFTDVDTPEDYSRLVEGFRRSLP